MYSTNSAFFESGPHSFNFYIVQNALSMDPTKTHHLLFSLREKGRVFISLLLFCLQFQKQKKKTSHCLRFFVGFWTKWQKRKMQVENLRAEKHRRQSQISDNWIERWQKSTIKILDFTSLLSFIILVFSDLYLYLSISIYIAIFHCSHIYYCAACLVIVVVSYSCCSCLVPIILHSK